MNHTLGTPATDFPKILPWLARKAGVTLPRAEALWRRAERFADGLAPRRTPVWSKLAVDHLLTSLRAESARHARGADMRSLWLLPARLWLLTAEACERASQALAANSRNRQRAA